MVELVVENYCKKCPCFEVEQVSISRECIGFHETDHILKCKHHLKCHEIYRYLKSK